jgi:hypothetical protein
VNVITYQRYRCKSTAADAGNPVNAEFAVIGNRSLLNLQPALPFFQDNVPSSHMACGPETDFDRMLSRGNKPELIEERCHPKNLSGSNSEKRGKVRYCMLGEKPKFGLDSLKNRNEVFSRGRKPFEERRDRFSNLFLFGFITAISHFTSQYIILVRLDQRGWHESLSTASDALFMARGHFFCSSPSFLFFV